MKTPRSPERRQAKRVPYQFPKNEVSWTPSHPHHGKGIGQDLSTGGMQMLCAEPLTQGEKVNLAFMLPWDLGRVECGASIQWVQKDGANYSVGVQFLKLTAEHVRTIKRYVAEANATDKKSFLVQFFSFFKRSSKNPSSH